MEACEFCRKEFDPQTNRYHLTLKEVPDYLLSFQSPMERFSRGFLVRCPHCGCAYVSETLRRFGFVTYKMYLGAFFLFAIAFIVFAWFSR